MGEIQVEGLLKLLRCSGQQLRSDDPASLKDIVNLVQDKTKGKEKTMTYVLKWSLADVRTRARYMIETLVNLKGGKAKSTQNTDDEAVNRMKRFLGGLSRKRRGMLPDYKLTFKLTSSRRLRATQSLAARLS